MTEDEYRAAVGRTVADGQVRHLSVSQLVAFDSRNYGSCRRRWWFQKRGGKREPESRAMKAGHVLHRQIEHYLATGEDCLGNVARGGLRFLPSPRSPTETVLGDGLLLEWDFTSLEAIAYRDALLAARREGAAGEVEVLGRAIADAAPLSLGGVPFIGRADLVDLRHEHRLDDGTRVYEPGTVEVVDHKSVKWIRDQLAPDGSVALDSRGWPMVGLAKTAEQLATSPQMVGYAEAVRRTVPWASAIRLSHGCYQKSRPPGSDARVPLPVEKRTVVLPLAVVAERWQSWAPLVAEMEAVAAEPDVSRVEASYDACAAYGGCPHREYCPRDPARVVAALANVRRPARAAGGGDQIMSLLAKMKGKLAAPAEARAPDPTQAAVAAERAKLLAEEAAAKGIAPPDAPVASAKADPIPEGSAPPGMVRLAEGQTAVEVDGVAVRVKPQKLGDGRWYALLPTADDVAAARAKPAAKPAEKSVLVEAPASKASVDVSSPTVEKSPVATARGSLPITIFADCYPDGAEAPSRLERYAHAIAEDLAEAAGAADVRCAPEGSALAFGKWVGALAAAARANPPPAGDWVVDTSDPVAKVVFDELAPRARWVVRGRR